MATQEQALEKVREICLAFPDTKEGDHFGKRAFYVKGKLFATVGEEKGVFAITFGLEPDHAEALVKNDPRFTPYPRDRRAVVLDISKVKGWNELKPLLQASYELRTPKKKPAVKAKPAAAKKKPAAKKRA